MNEEILKYNQKQIPDEEKICNILMTQIAACLPEAECKVWHSHPVWFLDGNPVVGYSKLKGGIQLLFWSGRSFEDSKLQDEGKFKAAGVELNSTEQISTADLEEWLSKSREIQWDYKNIVKRKGRLERLK
jgi:hypothetical protein